MPDREAVLPWRVTADRDFQAVWGARVLIFTKGAVIEGRLAQYLATTGTPVSPVPDEYQKSGSTPARQEHRTGGRVRKRG